MIIDFHTHIVPPEVRKNRERFFDGEPAFKLLYSVPESRLCGEEELVSNMDAQGIDKSVVFGFPWHREDYFKANNDYVLDAVERFKGMLIGFATAFPLARGAEKEFERCLKAGLSGIGELAVYNEGLSQDIRDRFEPVAQIARRLDVPILLHTTEPVGHAYAGKTAVTLHELYRFLRQYNANRFVLAHWGGGIFFYHLMKREVKEVLKNTWFDTAASPFLYDKEIYTLATRILGPDRILFGSDFPLLNPGRYFEEMKAVGVSENDITKMCGENAAHLLGIRENVKG
ncbi:MAG: amidohydrolase [Deltaproteobacteria bacterium]|nr:MAG: amidohydrolase [Deltaproteobacteria bacterium]